VSKRPGKRPPRPRSGRQLTPQQEQFCDEYFRSPSATQAAVRAGYEPGSAKQSAYKLLHTPKVKARLAAIAATLEQEVGITQRRLEREVEALAFSDLRDVVAVDTEGAVTVLASEHWSPAAAAAVKKVRQRRRESTDKEGLVTATIELEIELHPKLPAGELLGRLRKWLRTDTPFGGGQDGGGRVIPAVALPALAE
jgi:phage terminase small subunit